MKTIQLSTRVTQEDAEFLAALQVEGATTPSDKLRALIADARRRRQEMGDYAGSLRQVKQWLGPASERVLQVENASLPHSELVLPLLDWTSEALAFALAQVPGSGMTAEKCENAARELEQGLADRTFRLIDKVLRMAITERAPCYDGAAIDSRIGPILELARVIAGARSSRERNFRPVEDEPLG